MKPAILVIDEIDKMDEKDQSALYTVMETGIITELKTGRVRTAYVPVRVYAAGNTDSTLGEALKSRFLTFHLPQYTREGFAEIVVRVLTMREGKTKEFADHVATRLSQISRDPRDAVQIARLCSTKDEVDIFLRTAQKYRWTSAF